MDGTLTHAIHDFEAIKKTLGLPAGKPILESIADLPQDEAEHVNKQLDELEYTIAAEAKAHPHSEELLRLLQSNGCKLGIVTRNGHGIAQATLEACKLDGFFKPETIVSRDCCAPKPSPAGVELMLSRWSAEPDSAVMVGDYLYDLEAGKKAGVTTVHLDTAGKFPWPEDTDYGVVSLQPLAALWY